MKTIVTRPFGALLLPLLLAQIVGCSSDAPSSTVADPIEAAEATAAEPAGMADSTFEPESAANADVIVIDVRSKEEWDTGHVASAVHIPHTEIAERISEVSDNKDAKIAVYCAVGGRSGKAKVVLEEMGYTNVENAGGYDDVKDRF